MPQSARAAVLASRVGPIAVAALLMLWPALLNGYPLVFADTGTYLSQAIDLYLGWDRPVFYSLLLRSLHMTLTSWPVIVAQAGLVAWLLRLLMRCVLPSVSAWWLVPFTAALCACSALPWFVSQLMPDIFAPILVIVLLLLLVFPNRMRSAERHVLSGIGVLAIVVHTSHLPLALALLVTLGLLRWWGGTLHRVELARAVAIPCVGAMLLVAVNLVGHHRASVAPFGNIFLLARVIYDGPGREALHRFCPSAAWRLCPYVDALPTDSDHFLWDKSSPLYRAGGPKAVSAEADAIIGAALRIAPLREARAVAANTVEQLTRFATGDGLQPWNPTVRPVIARSFPGAELAAYDRARQTRGELTVPPALQAVHRIAAIAALLGLLLVLAVRGRRDALTAATAGLLLALLVNAAVTGGLSAPHDRYQARLVWLAGALVLLVGPALARERNMGAALLAGVRS